MKSTIHIINLMNIWSAGNCWYYSFTPPIAASPPTLIMEIISVDFYKTYRVSLFGKAILLLSCTSTHNEKK